MCSLYSGRFKAAVIIKAAQKIIPNPLDYPVVWMAICARYGNDTICVLESLLHVIAFY